MTVKELISYLETLKPEARVFEESGSELRELKPSDLAYSQDADGHPIDENEYTEDEWEELMGTPIVILKAWS